MGFGESADTTPVRCERCGHDVGTPVPTHSRSASQARPAEHDPQTNPDPLTESSQWEMPVASLNPIPWTYIDNEVLRLWSWRTPHFEARITADANSFMYEIVDYSNSDDGHGRFLHEGRCAEFREAENSVREHIGKAYPYRYGYAPYAGRLATTFTIATGESIDFAQFGQREMTVTIMTPSGKEQSFTGRLDTLHYEVKVIPQGGKPLKIRPSYIVRVSTPGSDKPVASDAEALMGPAQYTGIGRMYRGGVEMGCTGKPGYLPNTVDHHADSCPVHESLTMTQR